MSGMEDEHKPNGRPMSMLALNFAASLDSAFELTPEIETLSRSIARKRQSVSLQKTELEQLQTRIWEAEERLNSQTGSASTAKPGQQPGRIPARRAPGLNTIPLEESDEGEEEDSESSDSESEEDDVAVNKPLRNSQSTAQTSPSEASDSESEEEDDTDKDGSQEDEDEDEKPMQAIKQLNPKGLANPQTTQVQNGKRPPANTAARRSMVKQVQKKSLPSRGKA